MVYRAGVRGTSRHIRPRRPERPLRRPRPFPTAKLPAHEQYATAHGTLTEPALRQPSSAGAQRRWSCLQRHEQSPLRPLRSDARCRSVWAFSKYALSHNVRVEISGEENKTDYKRRIQEALYFRDTNTILNKIFNLDVSGCQDWFRPH